MPLLAARQAIIIVIILKLLLELKMSWFMFKETGSYQPRGKKCDGFENKAKPRVDLSWGIEEFDLPKINNFKPYSKVHASNRKSPVKPGIFQKREEEELEKMMKKFDQRKESDASHMFVMDDDPYNNPKERTNTESSSDRIRYLQNSLLPASRKDTMGALLNQEKVESMDLSESRISRRSQSGNKKNESNLVLGDGIYNSFVGKEEARKNFDQKIREMYEYEEKKNSRRVSQIQI